jgi:hypothetical protein
MFCAGLAEESGARGYLFLNGESVGAAVGFVGAACRCATRGGAGYAVKASFPIGAWVALPVHLHGMWISPLGDDDLSDRTKERLSFLSSEKNDG